MAVNVLKDGNFLTIDDGNKVTYFNASWCSVDFTDNAVIITDNGKQSIGRSYSIAFSDFEYNSVAKNTEADIVASLKDVIG